jgi:hypothetical protein
MALEALEYWDVHGKLHQPTEEAITAIKQALEQPVQPVAIALNTGTKQGVKWLKSVEHGMPLYTTPPAAKPAPVQDVSLIDEGKTAAQPAVPDEITDRSESPEYRSGWNDCRALMLEMRKP